MLCWHIIMLISLVDIHNLKSQLLWVLVQKDLSILLKSSKFKKINHSQLESAQLVSSEHPVILWNHHASFSPMNKTKSSVSLQETLSFYVKLVDQIWLSLQHWPLRILLECYSILFKKLRLLMETWDSILDMDLDQHVESL